MPICTHTHTSKVCEERKKEVMEWNENETDSLVNDILKT